MLYAKHSSLPIAPAPTGNPGHPRIKNSQRKGQHRRSPDPPVSRNAIAASFRLRRIVIESAAPPTMENPASATTYIPEPLASKDSEPLIATHPNSSSGLTNWKQTRKDFLTATQTPIRFHQIFAPFRSFSPALTQNPPRIASRLIDTRVEQKSHLTPVQSTKLQNLIDTLSSRSKEAYRIPNSQFELMERRKGRRAEPRADKLEAWT